MRIAITAPVFVTNSEHKKYLDLTTRSIISAKHDIVFIPVENYIQSNLIPLPYVFDHEPDEISIVKPEGQQSVARAWNLGIEEGKRLECEYILVINTDIVFKSNAIDRLVAFAQTFQNIIGNTAHYEEVNGKDVVMWTMSEYADLSFLEAAPEDENFAEHPHFSCFMVKNNFFDQVGKFDENFIPAYCEDGDMHARIALANKKAYVYGGARFYHFGSRTIKSDRSLWENNAKTFPKNQEYFLKKWGRPVENDVDNMRKPYHKYTELEPYYGGYFKHPYNEADKPLSYWRLENGEM